MAPDCDRKSNSKSDILKGNPDDDMSTYFEINKHVNSFHLNS